MLDKSDNDSSRLSVRSVGGQANKNAKNYHKNVNETIEEVEDEKEDLIEQANNVLTKSIERRRKAAKFMHQGDLIEGTNMKTFKPSGIASQLLPHTSKHRKKANILVDGTDPIAEELENED